MKNTEKKILKNINENDQNNRLHNLIEEAKFLKKKVNDSRHHEDKKKGVIECQIDFLKQLQEKYTELLRQVNEEPEVGISIEEDKVVVQVSSIVINRIAFEITEKRAQPLQKVLQIRQGLL